ncbi:MAG: hypothetical protein K6T55_10130 [Syntrophobacterales bacterium]|nr:hypothetical protein [Syntrophobacterales bacterium]
MNFLCRLILVVLLGMGTAAGAGAASSGPESEEAALYDLRRLGPVDLNPKTLTVEVYVAPLEELQPFRRAFPQVWEKVQAFYRRLGVELVHLPAGARPGPVAPAERLRLEVLPYQEWLHRTYEAFQVAPPFRLSFLAVCRNKYAFAHLPLSVIHFSFRRFHDQVLRPEADSAGQQAHLLAHLLIHELGHLMGLYHTHEFVNDPVEDYLPDRITPNFMSHDLTYPGELGFVPWQRQVVHSYLSKGRVYEQYRRVDFDILRYLERVKEANGFKEPGKRPPESPAG